MRKRTRTFAVIAVLPILFSFLFSQAGKPKKLADFFRIKLDGAMYQAVNIQDGNRTCTVVLDRSGRMVSDRNVLKKVFHAGNITGYFPEPAQRKNRFSNFLQTRVLQHKKSFAQALKMIPEMELLSLWAFNVGPRCITEALAVAFCGGAHKLASLPKALERVPLNTLKSFASAPKKYILAAIIGLLQEAIDKTASIESRIERIRDAEILDYEEIIKIEEQYWASMPGGYGALRMYQSLSGDIWSNLLLMLQNGMQELLSTEKGLLSSEQMNMITLAGSFEKMISSTKAGLVFTEELLRWKKLEKDDKQYTAREISGLISCAIEISEKYQKSGQTRVIRISGVDFEFVWIPPGEFMMGSPDWKQNQIDERNGPQHKVTITKGFWLGKYEVTQRQWQALTGKNPSSHKNAGPDAPVEQVFWLDCEEFIRLLNQLSGERFRLPTEAEWEYACRARSAEFTYDELGAIAWYHENSGGTTHPVGQKNPNAFGLYDMLGNVCEWCQDIYGDYSGEPQVDPKGSSRPYFHVYRGGDQDLSGRFMRPWARGDPRAPGHIEIDIGIRLAMDHVTR